MTTIPLLDAPTLLPKLSDYDKIIVSFSGGKDSTALVLSLLNMSIPTHKIELHHQSVDGAPGSKNFMDWPCTHNYVLAFSQRYNIRLCFQWREGGFLKELYKEDSLTGSVGYQYTSEPSVLLPTVRAKPGTRRKFPAKTSDLRTRWCSSSLKIDVARRCITSIFPNNPGNPLKILYLSGERREESAARSKYKKIESHSANTLGRIVHHYRMVIDLSEQEVWDLHSKFNLKAHPAYYLGFPRLSCQSCIFFSPKHWALWKKISPEKFENLRNHEIYLNHTIDNKNSLDIVAKKGSSSIEKLPLNFSYYRNLAINSEADFSDYIFDDFYMPCGAFGQGGGSL